MAAKNDAGVSNLVIDTTFEHNKGAMAYLDKGANNITVTFDNPAELAASGATFKVVYKWKEYDGTGWTIDKSYEHPVTASPTTFTITTGGTKVPRTESIRMELVEPPFDTDAPAGISNLVAGGAARDDQGAPVLDRHGRRRHRRHRQCLRPALQHDADHRRRLLRRRDAGGRPCSAPGLRASRRASSSPA